MCFGTLPTRCCSAYCASRCCQHQCATLAVCAALLHLNCAQLTLYTSFRLCSASSMSLLMSLLGRMVTRRWYSAWFSCSARQTPQQTACSYDSAYCLMMKCRRTITPCKPGSGSSTAPRWHKEYIKHNRTQTLPPAFANTSPSRCDTCKADAGC